MAENPMLLIGTRKGVFTLRSDAQRSDWVLGGPIFLGHIAQHVVLDPRNGSRLLLAAGTGHLGPTVFWSDDLGVSWQESARPPRFAADDRLNRTLERVFWLTPGHPSQPGVWWAGCTPQALFRSDDGGETWEPFLGWNDHPMWETWAEWPDPQTPDGSMLHSINIDPTDAAHMVIGLSGGGVFESHDAGLDWKPRNAGVEHPMRPLQELEFGHDPHCVRMHPLRPGRVYQQNHCGIYRIDDGDARWTRIGDAMPREIGDIGFPIELHPKDADVAWVFPMDGTDVWPRTSPGGIPAVYVTRDAGATWQEQREGLPARGWFTVKRQAMTTDSFDAVGVYFATTSGEVWASTNEGEHWRRIAAHLPEIYSLEFSDPASALC